MIQFLQGRVAESGVTPLKGAQNMREKQRRRKPTKQEGEGININRSCELDNKREEDGEAREKKRRRAKNRDEYGGRERKMLSEKGTEREGN